MIQEIDAQSPQQIFDKAVSYTAARWLTIGSPLREELSRSYCDLSLDERMKGIRLQRVNQRVLYEHLENIKDRQERIVRKQRINEGNVPSEYLLPEEFITYDALRVMENISRNSLNPGWDKWDLSKWLDNWKVGPISYMRLKNSNFQNFDLPHHIKDSVEGDELKGFFGKLEKYAGHPWCAHTYFFDSPTFSSGMGDASAKQELYLFNNGSFAHIVDTGRYRTKPGIYNPLESGADIVTQESFPDSPIKISYVDYPDRQYSVRLLDKDTIFLTRGYPEEQYFKSGSVVSIYGALISDPNESSKKILVSEHGKKPKKVTYEKVVDLVRSSTQ